MAGRSSVAQSGGAAWGGITGTLADQTDLDSALGAKADASDLSGYAPLASPALTGNPTAPTQSAGDDSTRLATTAFVAAAVAARKYAETLGDGVASAFTVTHNLNTLDVTVITWEIATGLLFSALYPTLLGTNDVLMEALSPPDPDQLRVVIHG